jgi:uncharacterized membrane protein (UPF0127 family)
LEQVTLRRESDGLVVCERCGVARSLPSRTRGLLGRSELAAGDGLLIPTWSIHMFFMRFAIDAVFLDRERHVLRIVENLRPWRTASCRGAKEVVELAAGEASRRGLAKGDRLMLNGAEQ